MKNDNWITALIITAVIAIAVIALGFFYFAASQQGQQKTGSIGESPNLFFSVATSSSAQVVNATNANASSTTVLPASTGRTWALISNTSSNLVMCNFGGSVATSSYAAFAASGFPIAASSTKQIDGTALFAGAINCASWGATSSVFVMANQ